MTRETGKWAVMGLLGLAVAAVVAFILLPLTQALFYGMVVQTPAMWWWGIIGGGFTFAAWYTGHEITAGSLLFLSVVMALMVGPMMSGVYAQEHMLENQQYEQVEQVPNTSTEHVRVLPLNVAERYADSANQLPVYQTGNADIAYHNGTYTWSFAIVPDKLVVQWMGNQWGAFYVDMEQTGRNVETSNTQMKYGMNMFWFDSYDWQMVLHKPLVDHERSTSFVFDHNGETHIARSYVTHEWHFRFTPIPQPYVVPEYSGTMVMDSNGQIQDMSPKQVSESEMMEGQNTYPYGLARFRMRAMQLQEGLMNKWFVGKNVPAIADTGGFSDNQQPFTVPTGTEENPELTYFIAATPTGSGSGIYQIYMIDAQTGKIQYVQYNNTLTGPEKAAGFTRSQNREPDWAATSDGGGTQITEPIPVVIDGDLYWHMRVTPVDGAQVSYTTFVNADTGTVYRADTTDEILEYIRSGGDKKVTKTQQNNTTQTDDGVFRVVVIENGTVVESYTVDSDQSVEVRPINQTNTTSTPG